MLKLSPQTGGNRIYEFLNLTHSGLVASLGGSNVSIPAADLNLAYHNPALLSPEMNKSLSLNYVNYLAGINYGMALYSRSTAKAGNFAGGLTYLNYGTFTEADPSGNITGTFRASEYSFSLIYSLKIDSSFTIGIDLKPVLSHLERYTSFGIAADIGAVWKSDNGLCSGGIVLRNAGGQITTYTGEANRLTPFEIQAGASARLAHAPLRFSLTIRHLEKFDLTHNYKGADYFEEKNPSGQFFENIMRHLIAGAELIPHKNFYLSAGYNYQRRKELMTESKAAGVGFSWGFGINTSFLTFQFGRASYHLAGASNHISLITRPDLLYKKARRQN
ncbi:MAG: type IX secretion system protein PorQ [Bacteroidales bacterium]|nr:type IX secretion system protein PorQ [Bacteroidales bacterium]